jgi:hypothetical protein
LAEGDARIAASRCGTSLAYYAAVRAAKLHLSTDRSITLRPGGSVHRDVLEGVKRMSTKFGNLQFTLKEVHGWADYEEVTRAGNSTLAEEV